METARALLVRVNRHDLVNRIDFGARLPVHVGDDMIFVLLAGDLQRLREFVEEVDDGRAAEMEEMAIHGGARRHDIAQINQNLKLFAERSRARRRQAPQRRRREIFRETRILANSDNPRMNGAESAESNSSASSDRLDVLARARRRFAVRNCEFAGVTRLRCLRRRRVRIPRAAVEDQFVDRICKRLAARQNKSARRPASCSRADAPPAAGCGS